MLQWYHRQINRFRCQKGQGMTEYIIIVAMVAIGAIVVMRLFGEEIRAWTVGAIRTLRGGGQEIVEPVRTEVPTDEPELDVWGE